MKTSIQEFCEELAGPEPTGVAIGKLARLLVDPKDDQLDNELGDDAKAIFDLLKQECYQKALIELFKSSKLPAYTIEAIIEEANQDIKSRYAPSSSSSSSAPALSKVEAFTKSRLFMTILFLAKTPEELVFWDATAEESGKLDELAGIKGVIKDLQGQLWSDGFVDKVREKILPIKFPLTTPGKISGKLGDFSVFVLRKEDLGRYATDKDDQANKEEALKQLIGIYRKNHCFQDYKAEEKNGVQYAAIWQASTEKGLLKALENYVLELKLLHSKVKDQGWSLNKLDQFCTERTSFHLAAIARHTATPKKQFTGDFAEGVQAGVKAGIQKALEINGHSLHPKLLEGVIVYKYLINKDVPRSSSGLAFWNSYTKRWIDNPDVFDNDEVLKHCTRYYGLKFFINTAIGITTITAIVAGICYAGSCLARSFGTNIQAPSITNISEFVQSFFTSHTQQVENAPQVASELGK